MVGQLGEVPVQAQNIAVAQGQQNVSVDAEYVMNGKNVQINLLPGLDIFRGAEGVVDELP